MSRTSSLTKWKKKKVSWGIIKTIFCQRWEYGLNWIPLSFVFKQIYLGFHFCSSWIWVKITLLTLNLGDFWEKETFYKNFGSCCREIVWNRPSLDPITKILLFGNILFTAKQIWYPEKSATVKCEASGQKLKKAALCLCSKYTFDWLKQIVSLYVFLTTLI